MFIWNSKIQLTIFCTETEATIWSNAAMDCIFSQLESEIRGMTSNDQMAFTKEFFIPLVAFEDWW